MNLKNLRKDIDNVDEAIIRLLAERFELTKQVGTLKAKTGANALSQKRENEQFEQFQELSKNLNLPYLMVEKIFQMVISQVRENHQEIKKQYESK